MIALMRVLKKLRSSGNGAGRTVRTPTNRAGSPAARARARPHPEAQRLAGLLLISFQVVPC